MGSDRGDGRGHGDAKEANVDEEAEEAEVDEEQAEEGEVDDIKELSRDSPSTVVTKTFSIFATCFAFSFCFSEASVLKQQRQLEVHRHAPHAR